MPDFDVVYSSEQWARGIRPSAHPILVLTRDRWDDFGYQTSFGAILLVNGEKHQLGSVKILVEGEKVSNTLLENAPVSLYGGKRLDFGEKQFLSLGHPLDFYIRLRSLLEESGTWSGILHMLHDTIYLEAEMPDHPALRLQNEEGFRVSLLRDYGSQHAFGVARQILFPGRIDKESLNFDLRMRLNGFSEDHYFNFRFGADSLLPTNIKVLIGKNGTGKTQALRRLVAWLLESPTESTSRISLSPFASESRWPQFSHVAAVSFSPFASFPFEYSSELARNTEQRDTELESPIGYTYCGLRRKDGRLSERYAWRRTTEALAEILQNDLERNNLPSSRRGRPKLNALLLCLYEGLRFEGIYAKIKKDLPPEHRLYDCCHKADDGMVLDVLRAFDEDGSLTIKTIRTLATGPLLFHTEHFSDQLSAGQTMFIFCVFGIIAAVRRQSLVVIDEPELYLHPNLEVAFMRMLVSLLSYFESYAVIATHSVFVVREVQSSCVQMITVGEGGYPIVSTPSFETFGADVSSLANLVFENVAIEKPFERQLLELAERNPDFDRIRSEYGEALSLQALTFLRNAIRAKEREQTER